MPILFDKEKNGWILTDPTDDERHALVEIAKDVITQGMGAQLAENIVGQFLAQMKQQQEFTQEVVDLEAIEVEDMPSA